MAKIETKHSAFLKQKLRLPDGYNPKSGHHGDQKISTSTRTASYREHEITIKTTYQIEIDGEPLAHTAVMDDGTVHSHGLPNYSFPSAIDLAKSIIDASSLAYFDKDEIGDNDDHRDARHHNSRNAMHDGGDK